MPLVKRGEVVDDPWLTIGDDEAVPEVGRVIVSLPRWKREQNALLSRGEPCGVQLKSDELAQDIASDVNRVALVALEFPKFRDGRASLILLSQRLTHAQKVRGQTQCTGP